MKQKVKVALIGTNGIPAKYGGFETLTEYLSKHLNSDYSLTVYCSKQPKKTRLKRHNNAKLIYLPFNANGWQSLIYDAISIVHALVYSNVLVIFGFSGVVAFPLKTIFNKKIVFNIGGIEWKKVRGNKSLSSFEVFIKKWFERICVRFSDVIVVDNQILWDYVKEVYKIDSVLAEYGGDHAVKEPITPELIKKYPFLTTKYDVTVSRAQEDMNIHMVIDAYKNIPDRNLVVISNWDISEYGIKLRSENKGKFSNIILCEAIYNIQELNAIRSNSSIYLHTHSLCGTAPSLVEAMYLGLPVICYDVDTNRAATEEKSLYFKDALELQKILSAIDTHAIGVLGTNMLHIAKKRYTWNRIVKIYKECIN